MAVIPLDGNEAAFSLAVVPFSARGGELHLVVGTAADTFVSPRSSSSGFLRTYKFINDGAGLEFQHKTEIDDVPLALMAFQGRLVAGVGKALRIYEIGKKKLLRKVENKVCLILFYCESVANVGVDILIGYCYSVNTRIPDDCRRHARVNFICRIQAT